jgi:hypothetical protein
MGDVIRRTAAAEDIFADVKTSLVRAQARGGEWKALAEGQLGELAGLIETIEGRQRTANTERIARQAVADAAVEKADSVVGKVADDIWNAVGRPASDPALSLLFPGGVRYYLQAPANERHHRLELLASLLESGIHAKLDPVVAKAAADAIRPQIAVVRAALETAAAAQAAARLATRMVSSLAQAAQLELANLKRRYRSEGFSEADIHQVIPDRPLATPKSNPPTAALEGTGVKTQPVLAPIPTQ